MNKVNNEQDLLRYGEYLTDDELMEKFGWERIAKFTRIRTIKYEGKIYYHKMVNGDCIECKELK